MSDIRIVLQQSLIALFDSKPANPLDFLADYFQKECEKNKVGQVAHTLSCLTIQNIALEERLNSAYNTLSQYKAVIDVYGLTGDMYNELLSLLLTGLPETQADKILQELCCHSYEYVSYKLFRTGVMLCLLVKEYHQEANLLFSDLDLQKKGSASKPLCDTTLAQLCMAATAVVSNPRSTLDVASKLNANHLTFQLSQESAMSHASAEHVQREEFIAEALEILLSHITSG